MSRVNIKKGDTLTINIFGTKQEAKVESVQVSSDYSGLIINFEKPLQEVPDRRVEKRISK
jgi:predicted lysophospholipase L1 biosynthesis ABC-type transport system permease subunit